MSHEQSSVHATEGMNSSFAPAPDPNSLAAAQAKAGATGNDRPSWLPENFKTVDDFVKSYNDLRGDHTRKSQELANLKKAGEEKPTGADNASDEKTTKALTDAGVPAESLQNWSDQFWETGEVPAEAYEQLAKVGITKEIIDDYAESKRSLVDGQRQSLLNAGGGEQQVQQMFQWASTNLNAEEINRYNAAFEGGDLNSAMIAMESLRTRFEASEGRVPELIGGGVLPTAQAGGVYTSVAQLQQDMSDPRYAMDPSYRKTVEQKLARSKIL